MPQQFFPTGAIASVSEAQVATFNLTKNLGRPGRFESRLVASVGAIAKVRNLPSMVALFQSGISGKLNKLVNLSPGTIVSHTKSAFKFFLNAAPVAPPIGTLHLSTLQALLNPKASSPRFGGRLVRGDLIPVCFRIQGEKMAGLNVRFSAKQKSVAIGVTPLTIVKVAPSTIKQTAPAIDPTNGVEMLTGNFYIEPGDTEMLPDGETEFSYHLSISDGNGRVYTLDRGSFTVFSP
jgi:hypothetical protein